jgi:Phage capsid protein
MSTQSPVIYSRQFDTQLKHLYGFDKAFLMDAVTIDSENLNGTTKMYSYMGSLGPAEDKSDFDEIATLSEPSYEARHIAWSTFYKAVSKDEENAMRMITQGIESHLMQEIVRSCKAKQTFKILDGFFADVVTGNAGGTTLPFDTTNNVIAANFNGKYNQNPAGANNLGLTMDKLNGIRLKISRQKVTVNTSDADRLHIAVCEDDIQSLLATKIGVDQYVHLDRFKTLMVNLGSQYDQMVDNTFDFNGFRFHVIPEHYLTTQSVTTGAGVSTCRRTPVWMTSGLIYANKQDITGTIVALPSTVESFKIQGLARGAALRAEDRKVYEIQNVVSP